MVRVLEKKLERTTPILRLGQDEIMKGDIRAA